eukprot:g522.t1
MPPVALRQFRLIPTRLCTTTPVLKRIQPRSISRRLTNYQEPRVALRPLQARGEMSEKELLDDRSSTNLRDLTQCCGHWVTRDCIAWRTAQTDVKGIHYQFRLYASYDGTLQVNLNEISNSDFCTKLRVLNRKEQYLKLAKFPHLFGCTLLQAEEPDMLDYPRLLKSQLKLVSDMNGRVVDVTGVQLPGVLDEIFSYDGPLGFTPNPEGVNWLRLWAPTCQSIEVVCWVSPSETEVEYGVLDLSPAAGGVWEVIIPEDWLWKYYKFRVKVYCYWSDQVEVLESTDPYSYSLSADGKCSQFVNLNAPELKPVNWDEQEVPELDSFSDISVYELHVRDFSIGDSTVPIEMRGKYHAFNPALVQAKTGHLSNGLEHLKLLSEAGMTHIHLLPVYDFATVPEKTEDQLTIKIDLSQFAPDSDKQQEAVTAIADQDGFNWGYDPVHFSVPEDVVYNHTYSNQSYKYSVFDRVVPGYYHRREETGEVCQSACGANLASEHSMMEKLVVDDVIHWVLDYKIDGFRFDIMGHLMLTTMNKLRKALDELTLEDHGVDGKKIYLYGEGWDFAETANNRRGRNAQQLNLGGTGIGTFNDRFRDSVLGGSPFGPPRYQGFITGLGLEPNPELDQGSAKSQAQDLLCSADLIRATISGNLTDYEIFSAQGEWIQGKKIKFHGRLGAYSLLPYENVVFCGCHDNETLFDHTILKASPSVELEQRVRMCEMAHAMILLSQGIAFIHGGDDLLRSKSLDRDSYNSGDWFNHIDWTRQSNNFGVGLPPYNKNKEWWDFYKPLLGDPELKPGPELIHRCFEHVLSFLRIRYSSPLFRISKPRFIKKQIVFYNTGPKQIPGVIIVELNSSYSLGDEGIFDQNFKRIVVLYNARPESISIKFPTSMLELHPVLCRSSDYIYSEVEIGRDEVKVPRRLTVVLVEPRE